MKTSRRRAATTVTVHDKTQSGCRYVRTEPIGRNYHPALNFFGVDASLPLSDF
jgi:hypothetical protein